MVPRISARGHSFKGAALYYLHDKDASTNERVEWTYVHNLPTNNAESAMKWMAHTAMNADRLKSMSGIAKTGRKAKAGEVYCYSLAWHPDQEPNKETMMESAFKTLELLNLYDHEAVFVSHNETDHAHVHVICNLIHPHTGKTNIPSYDRLTLSAWAEDVEKNEGKIRCEERVINNAIRNNQLDRRLKTKQASGREVALPAKQVIRELYQTSSNGAALQIALLSKGLMLAKGDRRGYVILYENGKTVSLTRQLEGTKAKELNEKLGDLSNLPSPKDIMNSGNKVKDYTTFIAASELWTKLKSEIWEQHKAGFKHTYLAKDLILEKLIQSKLELDVVKSTGQEPPDRIKTILNRLVDLKAKLSVFDSRIKSHQYDIELRLNRFKPKIGDNRNYEIEISQELNQLRKKGMDQDNKFDR